MLCIYNILNLFSNKKSLNLCDFNEIRIVIDDNWNMVPNGNIWLCYFDKNYPIESINPNLIKNRDDAEEICSKSIGYISYKITTGQIGLFSIIKKYQSRGLGKEILKKVIKEMELNGNKSVWAVTSQNHKFWSNVFDKSFEYNKRPHNSVTGSGYLLDINKFNKYFYSS
jgi:predicted acetyltransferase